MLQQKRQSLLQQERRSAHLRNLEALAPLAHGLGLGCKCRALSVMPWKRAAPLHSVIPPSLLTGRPTVTLSLSGPARLYFKLHLAPRRLQVAELPLGCRLRH